MHTSYSLLSSVLYFETLEFNNLSDHGQIKVTLSCKLQCQSELHTSSTKNWKLAKTYTWNYQSNEKLLECLSNDQILKSFVNFETKEFKEDKQGINAAAEELNDIFSNIANKSCKVIMKNKKKPKMFKQKWSDAAVYDQKKSLNFISSQIRKNPFDKDLRQKYSNQLKIFKQMISCIFRPCVTN